MTAKLKSNTILRQRFLAGVAHELRTPLTILKANLEGIGETPKRAIYSVS
jgi:two-component system sensor histidine kinase BaeS